MEQRTRLNFSVWCQKSCIPRVEVWGQSRATRLRLELLQTSSYIPQKHAYNLQNLHLFISFHINSLDIHSHLDSSHIHKSFSFFFFAMPSSVVLRSLRFLFTLLSTHNTTRPRTHRRKMERGRKRRRRKWEREMPPPMSGLEISKLVSKELVRKSRHVGCISGRYTEF